MATAGLAWCLFFTGTPAAEPAAGADLSFLPRMRQLGVEYRFDGRPVDPLAILRAHGYRIVRLRLWHTPTEPWQGLDSTLIFAREVTALGFDLLLDLHYSDTWADPGHQAKPAAWEGLIFPVLVDSIYAYTQRVVRRFDDAGALPRYLQIGNEIDSGFLWDDGRVGWPGSVWDNPAQWRQLTGLLRAAIAGARDSLPPERRPQILVHLAQGGNNGHCRWFFDHLPAGGIDVDAIAVSFYPWWHGTLPELTHNLHDLASRYARPLWVVETAYPWTLEGSAGAGNFVVSADQLHPGYPASPEGQLRFLRDLRGVLRSLPDGLGGGVLVWEPAFLAVEGGPPNPHENLTLFDFDGRALPGLGFAEAPDSSRGVPAW
ncbi:MAG: glycosyl hydrolase 53 family protein [Candidatus Eisenbacteria bacterium]